MARSTAPSVLLGLALGLCVGAAGCLTNEPDPNQGGIYACVDDEDCPGEQSCLQGTCETIPLPAIQILNPEDEKPFTMGDGTGSHPEILSVSGTDLILRPLAESSEAVPGEGHLVVFVDEVEVATIDSGDISAGVQTEIQIPDTAGVHRIRVVARLNDGTNYDNDTADARNLVWVDDGRQHVALRTPWPGQVFSLESQLVDAEVATFGGIQIGTPSETTRQHVHVYYGDEFPECLDEPVCEAGYTGVVPSNEDMFGPFIMPDSAATMVTLTAVVADFDHTTYADPMGDPVFSQIEVRRSGNP